MMGVTPTAGTIALLKSADLTGSRTTALFVFTDAKWVLVGHPADYPG